MGKHAALKFGNPALVRFDCAKCGEKASLHKHNACIHCGNFRGPKAGGLGGVGFTPRQIAAMRRLA